MEDRYSETGTALQTFDQKGNAGATASTVNPMISTRRAPRHRYIADVCQWLIHAHDRCFSDAGKSWLKRLLVRASITGFAVHLGLIFLAHHIPNQPLLAAVGMNYLSAIATPFNFILFYEVLTLIAALPGSTTRSIANQFEIVSLIFIRDVFKDIAAANGPGWIQVHPHQALPLFFDMWAGLLMFLLVTVFQHLASRQVAMPRTPELTRGRGIFHAQKKLIAIGLTVLLIMLAAYHLCSLSELVWQALSIGTSFTLGSTSFFYNDLFTVMIFTDVLILILSLVISGRYEMVFRNAAFVLSIILIRFSLTEERPYGAAIALSAMIVSILTLLIFNYHSCIRVRELPKPTHV